MTADPYGEGYLSGVLDAIAVVRARYVLTPRTPAAGPTSAQDGPAGASAGKETPQGSEGAQIEESPLSDRECECHKAGK